MPITFRCPHCQQELSAPDEAAGQSGKCRFCGATVQAPFASEDPAQLLQPGAAPPPPGDYHPYGHPTGRVNAAEILGEAWQVVSANSGVLIGAMLIVLAVEIFVSLVFLQPDIENLAESEATFRSLLLQYGFGAITGPLGFGLYYMAFDLVSGGYTAIGRLFAGYRRFGTLAAIALMQALPMVCAQLGQLAAGATLFSSAWVGTLLVGALVSAFVATVLLIAPVAVIDRDASLGDALGEGWRAVSSRPGAMLVTTILLTVVAHAGALACGIGMLWTYPVLPAGAVIVYRRIRGAG